VVSRSFVGDVSNGESILWKHRSQFLDHRALAAGRRPFKKGIASMPSQAPPTFYDSPNLPGGMCAMNALGSHGFRRGRWPEQPMCDAIESFMDELAK